MTELEKAAYRNDFIVPSKKEEQLSEDLLVPYLEDIQHDLEAIRAKINPRFEEDPKFPIGYCAKISTAVWNVVNYSSKTGNMNGVQAIRSYKKQKGIFKPLYVIKNSQGKSFRHQSFQVGKFEIDVAHDAMNSNEDRVTMQDVRESSIENIDSYVRYAEILESQCHFKIFSNTYYSRLAALFPFFTMSRYGIFGLEELFPSLIAKNVLQKGRLTQDFIDSPFQRELPSECKQLLQMEHDTMIEACANKLHTQFPNKNHLEKVENIFNPEFHPFFTIENISLDILLVLHQLVEATAIKPFFLDRKITEKLRSQGLIPALHE